MKKIVTAALAALFALLPLCACEKKEAQNPPYIEAPAPQLPEEPEKIPEIPVESPKEEIPEEPAEEPVEEPKELPKEEVPEEKPEEPSKPAAVLEKIKYVRVLTENLNIRTGAGTGYSSLGKAEKGVLLAFSGKVGSWYETLYRGKTAYVSANIKYTCLTELAPSETAVEQVISEGVRLLGTPYVYGATRLHDGNGKLLKGFSENKFDCSSLMQYIFYRGADVLLDVTTRTQIKQGKSVEADDLRRGDLLFFTNDSRVSNTGIERVGHVALYLGGNYILHTASDFAKIEQISAKRWDYFLGARRVL